MSMNLNNTQYQSKQEHIEASIIIVTENENTGERCFQSLFYCLYSMLLLSFNGVLLNTACLVLSHLLGMAII